MQISIGFCTHFIGICIGLSLGVGQCECNNNETTRKHSSTMRTARLPTVRVLLAATRFQYGVGWVSQFPYLGVGGVGEYPSSHILGKG